MTQAHLGSLEGFLDVLAAGNPHLESMLQMRRVQFSIPQPRRRAQEEEEEIDRRSQDFFHEFQNNP